MHESEDSLTLGKLLILCQRHMIMLVLWTVVMGALGFATARYIVTPKYTAQTELLVETKQNKTNNSQVNTPQTDAQLISTYKDLITSRAVLSKAANKINDRYGRNIFNAGKLQKAVNVINKQNSQVFFISVRTDDAQQSKLAADIITSTFKKQVKSVMHTNNVVVMTDAVEPDKPSFPSVKIFTLAGAILGFLLSFIYMLGRNLVANTRRLERERNHGNKEY